jgi:hypothetical protein
LQHHPLDLIKLSALPVEFELGFLHVGATREIRQRGLWR